MIEARRASPLNPATGFTLLRVALVPLFAWLLVVRRPSLPVVASVVFVVAAATDGVDGFLARRWDLVSGFGQFLDPLADKLLVGVALVALASDGRMAWWAVAVILAREVAVGVGLRWWLGRRGVALPASLLSKVKTNAQLLAILLATLRPRSDALARWAIGVAVALTVLSGAQYVIDAARGRAGRPWGGSHIEGSPS